MGINKMKSPMWLMFGTGLKKIFCEHKGSHEEWGYKFGTGMTELYCSKCGKIIKRIPLDDLPKNQLKKLIGLLQQEADERLDEDDDED
jgi:hypothetical protein